MLTCGFPMALDLTIEKLVYGGEGLSRVDGEVIFTPFVLPGEVVRVEPPTSKKHAQRANLIGVTQTSQDRVDPLCPIFGECGGCHYQHIDYPAQLRVKRGILAETLRRGAKIEFDEGRIAVVSGDAWGYRNRTQFHIEDGKVGYRQMRSQKLVPATECPISSPKINEALAKLNRMVKDRLWPRFVTSLEVFTDESQVQWNVQEAKSQPRSRKAFLRVAGHRGVPGTSAWRTGLRGQWRRVQHRGELVFSGESLAGRVPGGSGDWRRERSVWCGSLRRRGAVQRAAGAEVRASRQRWNRAAQPTICNATPGARASKWKRSARIRRRF